jgi:hypothetical protein
MIAVHNVMNRAMDCRQTNKITILTSMHRYYLLQYQEFCRDFLRVLTSKIRFSVGLQKSDIAGVIPENRREDFD